jgi:uncharacterized protein (UPF0333 family)
MGMEGRNIPLIIMLSAGSVVSVACIVYDFSLLDTLIIVLATLIGFYFIGQIVKKIILAINKNAEERAELLKRAEEKTLNNEGNEAEQEDSVIETTKEE